MNNCIICNKPIITIQRVTLDQAHEAHLKCWCNLLLNADTYTKEERDNRIKELIEKYTDLILNEFTSKNMRTKSYENLLNNIEKYKNEILNRMKKQ